MRKSWLYALAIGFLFWARITLAVTEPISDSVPVNVVNPLTGWDSSIKDMASGAIVVLVVRWFMAHIESKDKVFAEALSDFMLALKAKDDKYTELANACRAEHQAFAARVLAYMDGEKVKL